MSRSKRKQPPHPTLVETISPLHNLPTIYYLAEGTKRTDFCGRCESNLYACDCPLDQRPWLKCMDGSGHWGRRGTRRRSHQTQTYRSVTSGFPFFAFLWVSFSAAALTESVYVVFVGWPLLVLAVVLYAFATYKKPKPPPGGWYTPPRWS